MPNRTTIWFRVAGEGQAAPTYFSFSPPCPSLEFLSFFFLQYWEWLPTCDITVTMRGRIRLKMALLRALSEACTETRLIGLKSCNHHNWLTVPTMVFMCNVEIMSHESDSQSQGLNDCRGPTHGAVRAVGWVAGWMAHCRVLGSLCSAVLDEQ